MCQVATVMSDSLCPPGSSVHGILQARILEWLAMPFSRGSFCARDWTHVSYVSCTGRQILYHWLHLGSPMKDGIKRKWHLSHLEKPNAFAFIICLPLSSLWVKLSATQAIDRCCLGFRNSSLTTISSLLRLSEFSFLFVSLSQVHYFSLAHTLFPHILLQLSTQGPFGVWTSSYYHLGANDPYRWIGNKN